MGMDSPVDGIPWIFRMISSPAKCHETAESRLHECAVLPVVLLRDGLPHGGTLLRLARRREIEFLLNAGRHETVRQFAEQDVADIAPMSRRRKAERPMNFRMRIVQPRPYLDPAMLMAMDESRVFRA